MRDSVRSYVTIACGSIAVVALMLTAKYAQSDGMVSVEADARGALADVGPQKTSLNPEDLKEKNRELAAQERMLLKKLGEDGSSVDAPELDATSTESDSEVAIRRKAYTVEGQGSELQPTEVAITVGNLKQVEEPVAKANIESTSASLKTSGDDDDNLVWSSFQKQMDVRFNGVDKTLQTIVSQNREAINILKEIRGALQGNDEEPRASYRGPITETPEKWTIDESPTMIGGHTAEGEVLHGLVVADRAPVRTGPAEEYSRIQYLKRGEPLRIIGKQGDWYRIDMPQGVRAWIEASQVGFGGSE